MRICPWNGIVIGNLCEHTLEEVWHSKEADELRKHFMNDELYGCNEEYCPFCINRSDELMAEEGEMEFLYQNLPEIPEILSLAYDERCNHACPSCRHDFFKADSEYMDTVKKVTENIEPYLKKVRHLITNGIGDLFVTTEIVDMLSRLKPERPDFSCFFETNGVLFKKNWDKIEHLSKYPMTVSVTPNSFDKETYRYLAGVDDLERFEESMQFISEKKKEGKISHIRLIMVIQDSNFRQIPEFIKRGIEYDVDDITLRPIFKWFGMQEDELIYKNVLNPCHPYHQEYLEIINDPLCKDPRVLNWGFDVMQDAEELPTMQNKRESKWYRDEAEYRVRIGECVDSIRDILKEKKEALTDGEVIVFGAGKVGKIAVELLTCGEDIVPISGFAVSCMEGNPSYIFGYPVQEIEKYHTENTVVLVALAHHNQNQVKEQLVSLGFDSVIIIDENSKELD